MMMASAMAILLSHLSHGLAISPLSPWVTAFRRVCRLRFALRGLAMGVMLSRGDWQIAPKAGYASGWHRGPQVDDPREEEPGEILNRHAANLRGLALTER